VRTEHLLAAERSQTSAPISNPELGRADNPNLGPVQVQDISERTARAIYRSLYWNPLRADALPVGVDLSVFDMGVNAGIWGSARLLQRVLGFIGDEVEVQHRSDTRRRVRRGQRPDGGRGQPHSGPIPAIGSTVAEPPGSIPKKHSRPCQRIVESTQQAAIQYARGAAALVRRAARPS
jgi:hypothetical protein